MAIEKFWPAVPPQLFTADGTTLGIVTLADTAGFKVKQTVTIQSVSPANSIQVQVKRVVSSTQLIVGPLAQSLQPPFKQQGNQLLSVRQDISAYTVVSGAFIYAAEQPKLPIDPKDILQAVYRQEPGTTIGVEVDDQYGNPINDENPFPTNLWPASQIQFSLGTLALPTLVQNFLQGLTYDQVTSITSGTTETLTFYAASVPVTTITINKVTGGWTINLGGLLEDFLLLEDGDIFELEDGSGGILLEA